MLGRKTSIKKTSTCANRDNRFNKRPLFYRIDIICDAIDLHVLNMGTNLSRKFLGKKSNNSVTYVKLTRCCSQLASFLVIEGKRKEVKCIKLGVLIFFIGVMEMQ